MKIRIWETNICNKFQGTMECNINRCNNLFIKTRFSNLQRNIMQTGYGIQQAINADTIANMQNTNALQSQLAQCLNKFKKAILNLFTFNVNAVGTYA